VEDEALTGDKEVERIVSIAVDETVRRGGIDWDASEVRVGVEDTGRASREVKVDSGGETVVKDHRESVGEGRAEGEKERREDVELERESVGENEAAEGEAESEGVIEGVEGSD